MSIVFGATMHCGAMLVSTQGDLGSIEPKYDIAVSTAIRRLDNLVVETVDQAVQAIELLKQHDVGRATFICMDKMERWADQMRRLSKTCAYNFTCVLKRFKC